MLVQEAEQHSVSPDLPSRRLGAHPASNHCTAEVLAAAKAQGEASLMAWSALKVELW